MSVNGVKYNCSSPGCQWHKLPIAKDLLGKPKISYIHGFKYCHRWILNHSIVSSFIASVESLNYNKLLGVSILHGDGTATTAKKGGDNLGRNGHKHHKGDKVVAICDCNCNVVAPFITVLGNKTECPLFPDAFCKLKTIVKTFGIDILGSIMNSIFIKILVIAILIYQKLA